MDNHLRDIKHADVVRFREALAVAYSSDVRFPMGAVIYSGRKFVSSAANILKTHPDHVRRYGKHVISIHAEHRCILRARRSVEGATLYVARATGTGDSMPCSSCMAYMAESGIRYVVYKLKGRLWKLRI